MEFALAAIFRWTTAADLGSLTAGDAMPLRSVSLALPMIDFEELVNTHHAPLYRFALSLARSEAAAADLTQQTFYLWAAKGHQLRDPAKVKSWLFTTLYREHLSSRRHEVRFQHVELNDETDDLSGEDAAPCSTLDGATVIDALGRLDETYRAPLTLFYLRDFAYREIAEILSIPIGTVMSRLSRGKAELRRLLADPARTDAAPAPAIIPFPPVESNRAHE